MPNRTTCTGFALCVILAGAAAVDAADPARGTPSNGPAVPVALARGRDGRLWVALRDGRALAAVDLKGVRVVERVELPFRPSSLAVAGDGSTLLVGGMDGELLSVRSGVKTLLAHPRRSGPVRVIALDETRAALASPWDVHVRVIDWQSGRVERSIELPFGPGALLVRPGGRLVVAAAFEGRIADADLASGRVRERALDGVGARSLALSGDGQELLVVHATQARAVPVTEGNIDAGLVLSSRLSAVRLSEFDDDTAARARRPLPRRQLTLDGPRHGAADPSALAVSPDGTLVMIALAGAHQVVKNDRRRGTSGGGVADLPPLGHNLGLELVEVGRTPLDLIFDPSGERVVTADSMSDSLTVVRVADLSVEATIPLGDGPPRRTPAQRGEAAFLDGRLSLDRWLSCASCHAGGHTNGLNFDTLGDGGYGAPKNTPSLLGVGPTAPFAWTGRFPTLHGQIHQSLETSLHGPSADDATASDLSAYLRTLTPPPARRSGDDPAVLRGAAVFEARRCQGCHRPPHYTSTGLKDVGLDDGPAGNRAFNPPSLLGVGWSAPYFHDGRAATLDDVLATHPPGPGEPLSPSERNDLKAFLLSL